MGWRGRTRDKPKRESRFKDVTRISSKPFKYKRPTKPKVRPVVKTPSKEKQIEKDIDELASMYNEITYSDFQGIAQSIGMKHNLDDSEVLDRALYKAEETGERKIIDFGKGKFENKATIILNQYGGNKFVAMTGAYNSMAHGDGLSFKIPNKLAKDNINYVRVRHNLQDTYDVEYGTVWGTKYIVKKTTKGIYWDQLQEDFTRKTGLETSLGTMGR